MKYLYFLTTLFGITLLSHAIQAQKLVNNINKESSAETTPYISCDGKTIVYASNKSGAWEIYQSKLTSSNEIDEWSEPELIIFEGGSLGIGIELQDPALSPTSEKLYFAAQLPDSKGGKDIYVSTLKNGKWQKPKNVSEVNSFMDESSPMVSADKNYLFLARRYTGEKDDESHHKILFAKRNDKGKWSEPITVASTINSVDENYPFLSPDNKILYFSSKRENDLDGYNLYFSRRHAENVWTNPEPLISLNTDFDDIRPVISANSNKLYYAQFLKKKKESFGSIYQVDLIGTLTPKQIFEFTGTVIDMKTKEPIEAIVTVTDNNSMEKIGEILTKMPDGTFNFYFPKGRILEFEATREKYSYSYFNFNTTTEAINPDEPVKINFELFSKSILILNVFDEEIFEPLEGVLTLYNNNKNITEGRVSYKGNGRYEINLDIDEVYKINIQASNYEEYSFDFDLTGAIQFNEFERDIELKPSKTQFEINIADIETDSVIDEVEIIITNLEKNETIVKKVRKDENGKFVVDLRDGDKYEINVNGPKGYAFYNTKVDMSETDNKKLDVKLKALTAKTKLVLNDITFETNSADLNASSYEELDRVVKLLIDNPEIKMEISAHTDDVGSNGYNTKLSGKRAQSVVDYLVTNELPFNRLIAKGYGETTPVVKNDTEENRARNRRVELKIIDANTKTQNTNE